MKDALKERNDTEEQELPRRAPSRLAAAGKRKAGRRIRIAAAAAAGAALLSFGAYGIFRSGQVPPPDAGGTPVQAAGSPAQKDPAPENTSVKPDPENTSAKTNPAPVEQDPDPVEEPPVFAFDGLEDEASNTLHDILEDGMTPLEKARAIFDFTHDSIRYTGDSDKSDWEMGAYKGLTERRGDCFTYYAVSRALLTAAGIENLEVQRVGGPTSHFWNLVNCGSGWYHFDATPRSSKLPSFVSFMFTDQQAADYTAKAGRNYFTFDGSLYPERATAPCTDEPSPQPAEAPAAAPETEALPENAAPAGGENASLPENAPNGGAPEEEPVPSVIPADTSVFGPEGGAVLG